MHAKKANSWLDIGAGAMKAQLDWLLGGDMYLPLWRTGYPNDILSTSIQNAKRTAGSKIAVGLSVEDVMGDEIKSALKDNQFSNVKYLTGKFLEDYSDAELGKFDLITDVYGAVSYAPQIDVVFQKAIHHLKIGGRFYTHIQPEDSHRTRDGGWNFKILNSPFDQIESLKVWLDNGTCFSNDIKLNDSTGRAELVIIIEKLCEKVTVPALKLIKFKHASPPTREYELVD